MANNKRPKFSLIVETYIRENIIGVTYEEMAKMLTEYFGETFTKESTKKFCNKKGITNYVNKWSEEEKQYLIEHISDGKSYLQLADEVSKVIGVSRKEHQVRDVCYRMGLHNGIDTKYKDGHPSIQKPIGHELKCGRKTYIKVRNTHRNSKDNKHNYEKNYKLKQNYLWEKHFGRVPKGWYVVFRDGDRTNFELENLACISKNQQQELNKRDWNFLDNIPMRKTAIEYCVLKDKIRTEERKISKT